MPENSLAQKIKAQHNFFNRGLTKSPAYRIKALKELQAAVKREQNRIIDVLRQDLGKPAAEAYLSEISPVMHELSFAIKHVNRWQKPEKAATPFFLQPAQSRIYHEPYGVCLIIAPWNYPFGLCLQPLISAIAAGNCVTVKPSYKTPATARLLRELLASLFSDEFVQVTAPDEYDEILNQTYDFIFFTGGAQTGQQVMRAAAQNLTPVVLELGGKSPCLIDPALNDFKTAARRIMWGKFFNAGQTCIAPDYILAPKARAAEIIEHFKIALNTMYAAQTPVIGQNYTRIINAARWQTLNTLLKSEQAKIIYGGETRAEDLYIAPTLFNDVAWDSPLMQGEIFGPLLPIVLYDDLTQLLATLAAQPKPLAFYIFSKNRRFINTVNAKLNFGGGCVNTTLLHYANPHLPFGGVGFSGMGRYHGQYGFKTFSHAKALLHKPFGGEPKLQYQPYTKCKLKLLRKFL